MVKNLIPTISVIMPVYNCFDYIQEAVNSILNQTFDDFELIIIDDNSTDGTVELIKNVKDPRIKCILKPVNTGITNSLNFGLKIAKGKYIARMDGDDVSFPDRFEQQVRFMDLNPRVVLCGGGYISIDSKKEFIPAHDHANLLFEMTYHCPIAHPTVFIRKKILLSNKIEYDPKYEPAEDFRMWTVLSKYGEIANIKEPLIRYRIHPNQASVTRALKQKTISNIIASDHVRYLSNNNKYFKFFIGKKIESTLDMNKYLSVEEDIKKHYNKVGLSLDRDIFLKRLKNYLRNSLLEDDFNIINFKNKFIFLIENIQIIGSYFMFKYFIKCLIKFKSTN